MSDYLADLHERMEHQQDWRIVQSVALASIADSLAGLLAEYREVYALTPTNPPQGSGEPPVPDQTPAVESATTPAPAESSLVALDRADEALRALLAWRETDRLYPPDDPQGWPALLRLRDVADRLGGAS